MKNFLKTTDVEIRDTAGLLERVRHLLEQGSAAEALDTITNFGRTTPAISNARGVCLLRLGRAADAMHIFRDLIFTGGGVVVPPLTPTIFLTNYVTAMLMMGNPIIANAVLYNVPDQNHPAVAQLRAALRAWRQSLSWWRRLLIWIGECPDSPVLLDFTPGRLLLSEGCESPQPLKRAA